MLLWFIITNKDGVFFAFPEVLKIHGSVWRTKIVDFLRSFDVSLVALGPLGASRGEDVGEEDGLIN